MDEQSSLTINYCWSYGAKYMYVFKLLLGSMNVCSPYFVTSHIYKLFIVFWWIESWIEFHSRGNWLSPGHTIMHICIKTANTRAHAQFFFRLRLLLLLPFFCNMYIGHWHRFAATPTLELVMNLVYVICSEHNKRIFWWFVQRRL